VIVAHNKKQVVLRTVLNSLLSLLVVTTFMWGGCVSCEQYFMFPGKHQPCCNQSGQCERPGKNSPKPEKRECNRLSLQRTSNASVVPLPAVLSTPITPLVPRSSSTLFRVLTFEALLDPSPPDILAFNATFLI
jgi:hypothetical protein